MAMFDGKLVSQYQRVDGSVAMMVVIFSAWICRFLKNIFGDCIMGLDILWQFVTELLLTMAIRVAWIFASFLDIFGMFTRG